MNSSARSLIVLFGLTISSGVMAQPIETVTSATVNQSTRETWSRGWRVSLLKPLAMELSQTGDFDVGTTYDQRGFPSGSVAGFSESGKGYPEVFGLGVGYESLAVREAGWIVEVGLMQMRSPRRSSDNTLLRLEGDFAYSVSRQLYAKAGANLSTMTSLDDRHSAFEKSGGDFGLGFQVGLGYRLGRNFGIEVAYLEMSQTVELSRKPLYFEDPESGSVRVEQEGKVGFNQKSAEISVNTTF